MTPMKTFRIAALLSFAAVLLVPPEARAQTVLSSTTLSAALSNNTSNVTFASGTGITAPGPNGTALTVVLVDREIMLVQTLVTGTTYTVARGQYGTDRVAHLSGATVWVAPDKAIARGAIPTGSCTRTAMPYVPIIYVSPVGVNNGLTGGLFDCVGGVLLQTNSASSTLVGATVSSATSITPTGTYFIVSGTTAVATIVVPAGWAAGKCLAIQPSGIFATTTAANIGLITSATVVGRVLFMCWDGSKWWPSYVS